MRDFWAHDRSKFTQFGALSLRFERRIKATGVARKVQLSSGLGWFEG
jgi:hypothetical protein